jgi:two-component system, OmpR family, sensor kinase
MRSPTGGTVLNNVRLVHRVAWAATLAATAAALLAALATSLLAAVLLQRAEDRRLHDAAQIVAVELSEGPPTQAHAAAVVQDETIETDHTGLVFGVRDSVGQPLAGDDRLLVPVNRLCSTEQHGTLRVCAAQSSGGLIALAAASHTTPTALFALSALFALALAAAAGGLVSRPLSRTAVAPLARLRQRLAALDLDTGTAADLGPAEAVVEVDALRATIAELLGRVQTALDQARRFAANAAHELRTPLTTVRAEIELLRESMDLDAPSASAITRVQRHVTELNVLVERLLILATPRAEANAGFEIVSLRDLIEDATLALGDEAVLQITPGEGDANVSGDAVLLGTLVLNALSNAVKFGKSVSVQIAHADSDVVLTIDDDGPGVALAERERVFEPFFRSNDAARRRIPGHGLGLALVRHIAQTHGGNAAFLDKPTPGARLAIRLPRR